MYKKGDVVTVADFMHDDEYFILGEAKNVRYYELFDLAGRSIGYYHSQTFKKVGKEAIQLYIVYMINAEFKLQKALKENYNELRS